MNRVFNAVRWMHDSTCRPWMIPLVWILAMLAQVCSIFFHRH